MVVLELGVNGADRYLGDMRTYREPAVFTERVFNSVSSHPGRILVDAAAQSTFPTVVTHGFVALQTLPAVPDSGERAPPRS